MGATLPVGSATVALLSLESAEFRINATVIDRRYRKGCVLPIVDTWDDLWVGAIDHNRLDGSVNYPTSF